MKAEELRIGNWVKKHYIRSNNDRIINEPMFSWDFTCMEMEPNLYEPIPLSEEILLKCGFEKVENYNPMFIHCTSPLRIKANKYTQSKKIDCRIYILKSNFFYQISRTVKVKLDYLHQLQNLYWCLCEKELICNLK